MSSENPFSADNQQERPGIEQWVVGFTDGEGCFSISVVRNDGCALGWQVQHEFSVTQLTTSKPALETLRGFFGCGSLIVNRRHDDHREDMMRFSVKRRSDLTDIIIPFFEQHPLITAKANDFELFTSVIEKMAVGEHLTSDGLREIASITECMNRKKRSRYLESPEAIRQPTHPRR